MRQVVVFVIACALLAFISCAEKNTFPAVTDDELSKSLRYPDWDPMLSGWVTIEALFHYVSTHFDWHAAQIEGVLTADCPGDLSDQEACVTI